jgi:hypothetical protein
MRLSLGWLLPPRSMNGCKQIPLFTLRTMYHAWLGIGWSGCCRHQKTQLQAGCCRIYLPTRIARLEEAFGKVERLPQMWPDRRGTDHGCSMIKDSSPIVGILAKGRWAEGVEPWDTNAIRSRRTRIEIVTVESKFLYR